jgi:hypothetical protein
MDEVYQRSLERAIACLCRGADPVCTEMKLNGRVPRFNPMTGGYGCCLY